MLPDIPISIKLKGILRYSKTFGNERKKKLLHNSNTCSYFDASAIFPVWGFRIKSSVKCELPTSCSRSHSGTASIMCLCLASILIPTSLVHTETEPCTNKSLFALDFCVSCLRWTQSGHALVKSEVYKRCLWGRNLVRSGNISSPGWLGIIPSTSPSILNQHTNLPHHNPLSINLNKA